MNPLFKELGAMATTLWKEKDWDVSVLKITKNSKRQPKIKQKRNCRVWKGVWWDGIQMLFISTKKTKGNIPTL